MKGGIFVVQNADDKKYYLAIVNEGKKNDNGGTHIYGYLSDIGFYDDANRFDPLAVFGELMNTALDCKTVHLEEWKKEDYSFKETYKQHPFFLNKGIRHAIDIFWCKTKPTPQDISDELGDLRWEVHVFLIALVRVLECFSSGKSISLSDLEITKIMNKFRFTFEIESGSPNPYYRYGGKHYNAAMDAVAKNPSLLDTIKKNGMGPDSPFYYLSVDFCAHVDTERVQNYLLDNKDDVHRFSYTCYSLEEVLFALWHYLIFHGYTKFNQCHHCGTYFATKTLKQKYCTQKSPYKGYTNSNCEQAVRDIKRKLARRKKSIYTNLGTYYSEDIRWQFEAECYWHEEKLKTLSSVENLKAYERSLDKQAVKEKWYTDENKKRDIEIARTAE